jgi:hypothetical protein
LLREKDALETLTSKRTLEGRSPRIVDARAQLDGSVLVYVDGAEAPEYKLEVVVTDLKQVIELPFQEMETA